jgi:hypothetical protein
MGMPTADDRGTGAASDAGPRAELLKFPHPYQAALTVASDIDNASYRRFTAIHALLGGREAIRPGTDEWQTLGLSESSAWYDAAAGGVPGLGLDFADSFFLIADAVTLGMYRDQPGGGFREDESDGHNAADAIRGWLQRGQVDSFHAFHHYTRGQVLPLLEGFYAWCEREGVAKPSVWLNHSLGVTPTGLAPSALRPNRVVRLARQIARATIGPLLGRERRPLSQALVWYEGARPGSRYYVNDILAANGLRYVWMNAGDALANRIALPERTYGDRPSILDIVTMDDGVRYYHFPRCFGKPDARPTSGLCLRQSEGTTDTSSLFTQENLERLCRDQGTCILFTHWTLKRSFPISDETIGHFDLVRRYRDAGRIWVAPLAKLLEWTRIRTFAVYRAWRDSGRLMIDIEGANDPILGQHRIRMEDCRGLSFRVPSDQIEVVLSISGQAIPQNLVQRRCGVCWVK